MYVSSPQPEAPWIFHKAVGIIASLISFLSYDCHLIPLETPYWCSNPLTYNNLIL